MKEVLDIDDATVVNECRRGDREAMSLLYTRHAPRMLRLISRYVDDPDDAKDILHDGFIVAFTRIDTLHDPAKVDHWLATIMKNLSLKFLQEQSVVSILDEIPESPGDDCEIDDIIDFETLETLISRLPDGYQKVFRLAVLENKSHKEIAQILGIAPNSSSSQLFHAKVLLRRLITEYKEKGGAFILLLIAAATGTYLYFNKSGNEKMTASLPLTAEKVIHPVKHPAEPSAPAVLSSEESVTGLSVTSVKKQKERFAVTGSEEMVADSIPTMLAEAERQDVDASETGQAAAASKASPVKEDPSEYDYILRQEEDHLLYAGNNYGKNRNDKGWSAGISVDPGILNFDNSVGDSELNDIDCMPNQPNFIHNHLKNNSHKNLLPISAGISVEKRVTSWLGIESGITYTYLQSDFEYREHYTRCRWHYIGIPLKANMYAYSSSHVRIYGSVGGGVAIPVYSNAKILSRKSPFSYSDGKFSSPVVWSLGGSIGVSVPLSRKIDVYIEPTVRYNFPHDYTVPNAWSDDPWTISIPIGVRFKW